MSALPRRKPSEDAGPTEDSVALLFARKNADDIRWCPERECWFVWSGGRWTVDGKGAVMERARDMARYVGEATGKAKWGSLRTIRAVETLARTQPELVAAETEWNADPWLLGTPSGVVDLREGAWRPGRRADMVSLATAVDPAEGEPTEWLRFLLEATAGDRDLILYLKKLFGYCLTGLVTEQNLYFVYGPSQTGKSTLLRVLRQMLGEYAFHAAITSLMSNADDKHPADLAMMRGRRLVTSSETDKDKPWAEARIKTLTGGDPVSAHFMHRDWFTFEPTHKLVIVGNNRPLLRVVDRAATRRYRMIPFLTVPSEADDRLEDALRDEYPRILAWAVEGCVDWQAEGMTPPEAVRRETEDYFEGQDSLGAWLLDCCDVDPPDTDPKIRFRCLSSRLFGSWVAWCKAQGEQPGSNKSFSEDLERRGFRKARFASGVEFLGVRVRPQAVREDER